MPVNWGAYVGRAQDVAFDAEQLWSGLAPQTPPAGDHLRLATYSLRTVLLIQYHAVLTLLRNPLVAFAGESLLRGELEALAHLAWIAHGEPRSNRTGRRLRSSARSNHCFSDNRRRWSAPQTRALCWLMSDAAWFHKNTAGAHASVKDPGATRNARWRAQRLERLHKATGCPGKKGRDQTDVAPMLVFLGRRFKLQWLPDLWRAYSATAHQGIPVRLASSLSPGAVRWGGPLPDGERRSLLVRNVTVFLNAYQYVMYLSAGDATLPSFKRVVADPAMRLNRELNALKLR